MTILSSKPHSVLKDRYTVGQKTALRAERIKSKEEGGKAY